VTPKFALLRDGARWEAVRAERLVQLPGGALTLARIPGAPVGGELDLPGPWDVLPSGLAASGGRVLATDTDGDRLLALESSPGSSQSACGTLVVTGLGFDRPRGLAVAGARLFAADSGNGRIQVFRLPGLELDAVWQGEAIDLVEPGDLAADSAGRIVVADLSLGCLRRFSPAGAPDRAWDAAVASHAELRAPRFVAADGAGRVWVSDHAARRVFVLDAGGALVASLELGAQPGALAVRGDRLLVADAASGELRAWDLAAAVDGAGHGVDLGIVPGVRAPVTALAAGPDALLVKTDASRAIAPLPWEAGCARRGRLVAGPLDAGAGQTWERLHVDARGDGVELSVQLVDRAEPPDPAGWMRAAALDTLVPPPPADGSAQPRSARHLWLTVELTSSDGRRAPVLEQIEARTVAPSYIDDLPSVYARRDAADGKGFLRRWLALFRAELGAEEELLDEMARRFDPRMVPASRLEWLSGWVALELPERADAGDARALIEAAHDIHTRRGTSAGLREAVLRETGLHVDVIEAHRERRIWQLGAGAGLGLDTALPAASPHGAVVPDPADPLVVGSYVVGQAGPLEPSDRVTPLFEETAHLFTVVLPPGTCVDEAARARLREVIDAEKPSHTDYHLCQVGARMRIGFQARLGVDSLVAGAPPPMRLAGVRLGFDSFLGDADQESPGGRVGSARIGRDTVLAGPAPERDP
jgi:phage tail-like protein